MKTPTREQVAKLRAIYGLTQDRAATMIHVSRVTWARWETGEREMHPAFYELARIKMSRIPTVRRPKTEK